MARSQSGTKQKLIDTAIELIWRNSYSSVSVDEICNKAGVQKGSFYHFFPSKADLALKTMESCQQEAIVHYDDIFSPKRHPIERLELIVDHICTTQEEKQQELGHVCGCPMMSLGAELAGKEALIDAQIQSICAIKISYYEKVLVDLIAKNEIDKDIDVKQKAELMFSLVVGQLFVARIKNDLSFIKHDLKDALVNLAGLKSKELV